MSPVSEDPLPNERRADAEKALEVLEGTQRGTCEPIDESYGTVNFRKGDEQ